METFAEDDRELADKESRITEAPRQRAFYVPLRGSKTELLVRTLHTAKRSLSARQLSRLCPGCSARYVGVLLGYAIRRGAVVTNRMANGRSWEFCISPDWVAPTDFYTSASTPKYDFLAEDIVTSKTHAQIREFMQGGNRIPKWDPTEAINSLLLRASEVIAAKSSSRFNGAEVDALVARELRSIDEAAQQAIKNLDAALAAMQIQ